MEIHRRGTRTALAVLSLASLVLIVTTPVLAQPGGPVPTNRGIVGIATEPGPTPGTEGIMVLMIVSVRGPSSSPIPLSTNLNLFINGVPDVSTTQVITSLFANDCGLPVGGCATGLCGSWSTGGVNPLDGICRQYTGPTGPACECARYFVATFPATAIAPGDEITVTLSAPPGTPIESDTSDDSWTQIYSGPIAGTNRAIASIELVPAPGGNTIPRVHLLLEGGPTSQTIPLDTEIEVLLNGGTISLESVAFGKEPGGGSCELPTSCSTPLGCSLWQVPASPPIGGTCLESAAQQKCACTIAWTHDAPAAAIPPGTQITVILRAAPGAVLDLPGLPVDHVATILAPSAWRRLATVALHPGTAPGTVRAFAFWEALALPSSGTQDLSAELEVLVNGVSAATISQLVTVTGAGDCSISGGCSSGLCGSWSTGGAPSDGVCRETAGGGAPGECMCGHWFATELPEVPAAVGDEITVILRPAAGALGGVDSIDDWAEVFTLSNTSPNRRIGAVSRTASPGGGTDLSVEVLIETGGFQTPIDMSFEACALDDQLDPLVCTTIHLGAAFPDIASCDGPLACTTPTGCTIWNQGPVSLGASCLESPSQYQDCICTLSLSLDLDAVPVDPDDDLVVILKPAPGGMPELPPLEGDDEEPVPGTPPATPPFRRGDCNADGGTDIGDPIMLLGELFAGAAPVPCEDACDANDDGMKDIGDPIHLLGGLFSGGPLPPPPLTACGQDPTADPLRCASFPPCVP